MLRRKFLERAIGSVAMVAAGSASTVGLLLGGLTAAAPGAGAGNGARRRGRPLRGRAGAGGAGQGQDTPIGSLTYGRRGSISLYRTGQPGVYRLSLLSEGEGKTPVWFRLKMTSRPDPAGLEALDRALTAGPVKVTVSQRRRTMVSTATVLKEAGKIRLDAPGGANPAFFEIARGGDLDSALAVLIGSVIRGLLGPGNWFRAPVTVSTPDTGSVTFLLGREPNQG